MGLRDKNEQWVDILEQMVCLRVNRKVNNHFARLTECDEITEVKQTTSFIHLCIFFRLRLSEDVKRHTV